METPSARFVDEPESKRLGIAHGWYGVRVSGTLVTAACSTQDECIEAISRLPKSAVVASLSANDSQLIQNVSKPRSLYGSTGQPVFQTAYDIARKPSRQRNR
jgi:hypothetical protein